MGSVKVTVFGRIKPYDKSSQEYKLSYGDQEDQITFTGSKMPGKKSFRFKKIFDENATQEQVFEAVAKPVINSIFLGYNGTIFTYGQTGSGKTYTMTGDLENCLNTGLIPRTIQEIFRMKAQDTIITVTFCEIYNEHIYDLIRVDRMESDLAQVSLLEVNTGVTHLRNLSAHKVTTPYEAIQLFLRGDANKMVAETGSNARSSRSHVIFSIGLELPHPMQENLCLKPILYLVDLAGSEKLSKCKTPLSNPCETRYINLSLHYLEQVLIALRQPGRIHIPYRNSLMTALLRNSLGGNCITAMIATFSVALNDTEETLQTCRFAERIALIKNEVKLTESSSPEKEIDLLKKENERLKAQINLLTNEQISEKLSEQEKEKCAETVYRFIKSNDYFELPLSNIRRMEYCFQLMREEILKNLSCRERENEKSESAQDLFKLLKNNNSQLQSQESKICAKKNSRKKRNPLDLPKINITYNRRNSTGQLSGLEKENEVTKNESHTEVNATELNYPTNYGLEDLSADNSMKLHKQNSLIETSTRDNLYFPINFPRRKDIGISKKDVTEKSSNSNLKLSGEIKTTSKNLINVSTSNSSSKYGISNDSIKPNLSNGSIKPNLSYSSIKPNLSNDSIKPNLSYVCIKSVNPKPEFPRSIISETAKNSSDEKAFYNEFNTLKSMDKGNTVIEKPDSENHSLDKTFDQLSLNSNDSNDFSARCVPLTGDKDVDEEILKFYKSRYQLFKNK